MELVLTKSVCWEYEKEWRVLHNQADCPYGVERNALVGLYFGASMPSDQMEMIASLLDWTDVKLHKMKRSDDKYALVAEPLTFNRIDYRTRDSSAS